MNNLILFCCAWIFLCTFFTEAKERPNFILLMGDDHGWAETGYNEHPHLKTPILDEMAKTGLRLDHFYAAHPTCSPTRGSFLTGRHPTASVPSPRDFPFGQRKSRWLTSWPRLVTVAGISANGT